MNAGLAEQRGVFCLSHACSSLDEIEQVLAQPAVVSARRRARSVLVQLYTPPLPAPALRRVVGAVREWLPEALIVGATAREVVASGCLFRGRTSLCLSFFDDTDVRGRLVEPGDKSALLGLTNSRTRLVFLLAGLDPEGTSRALPWMVSGTPGFVPVLGGTTPGEVFLNQEFSGSSVAAVSFDSDSLEVYPHTHLGWNPLGRTFRVTRAEGTRLYELDGAPAGVIYDRYLGLSPAHSIRDMGRQFPLLKTGQRLTVARLPLQRMSDDSLLLAGDLSVGDEVRISYGDIRSVLNSGLALYQELARQRPQGIYLFCSTERQAFLQSAAPLEMESLQRVADAGGFCSSSEFLRAGGATAVLNSSLSLVGLSEGRIRARPRTLPRELLEAAATDTVEVPVVAMGALSHFINAVTTELEESNRELERLATTDALTGIHNRREFFRRGAHELERSSRTRQQFCILLMDLDHFKAVNDTYGHAAGDEALKAFARVCKGVVRNIDVLARLGGEEFALLLPETTVERAMTVADRVRREVGELRITLEDGRTVGFTVSAGLARSQEGERSVDDVLARADQLLYQAKEAGRDQVAV